MAELSLSALGISTGFLTELQPPPGLSREVTAVLVTCTEPLAELLVAEAQRGGDNGQVPLPPLGQDSSAPLDFPPSILFLGARLAPCSSFLTPKLAAGSRNWDKLGEGKRHGTRSSPPCPHPSRSPGRGSFANQ